MDSAFGGRGPILAVALGALLTATGQHPAFSQAAATLNSGELVLLAISSRDQSALSSALSRASGADAQERALWLLRAVQVGDRTAVSLLLRAGSDPKHAAAGQWPPLLVALLHGRTDVARDLIAAGADVSVRTPDGVSAADLANTSGDQELMRLVRQSMPPRERLFAAIDGLDTSVATAALGALPEPDVRDERGWTPLMRAALVGSEPIATELLRRRADPNARSPDGATPLTAAVLGGVRSIANRLLDAGAQVDGTASQGRRPLVLAIALRDQAMVELLLSRGARKEAVSGEELPPGVLATAAGLNANALGLSGTTRPPPSSRAIADAIASSNIPALRQLADRGADLSAPLPNGLRPLHFAVAAMSADSMRFLIERGASFEGRNRLQGADGGNILHTAARVGATGSALEALQKLILTTPGKWDELNEALDERGRTPILLSVISNTASTIWFLQSGGVSIRALNARDRDGVTPLLAAVVNGNSDVVKWLRIRSAVATPMPGRPSVQDVARSQSSWAILAQLPYDREIDLELVKGASRDVRSNFQRNLAALGYYRGQINGSLSGPTAAAMRRFLLDQEQEISRLATERVGQWGERRFRDNQEIWGDIRVLSDPGRRGWFVYTWTNGHKFIGYAAVGPIRNGFGLYIDQNGSRLMLLGRGGWDDAENIN